MNCTRQTDPFITGERGGRRGGGGIWKGLREISKRWRDGGREEEERWEEQEARWGKKDERKESVLGEMSGRKRCGARLKDR